MILAESCLILLSTPHIYVYILQKITRSPLQSVQNTGEAMNIDTVDTAWVLVATALVMVMTPALAFFYGGMVRKKNILSTLNLSFIILALISIQWVLFGY